MLVFGAIILQLFALYALTNLGKACIVNEECAGRPKLLDLGRGYYPQFLFTLECDSKCLPYICTPQKYNVKVLRRRRIEDITVDGSLPESLRESWRFVYKPVTVACLCNIYSQEQ
ncbi:prothoracicotropic hormone [Halyomorpha halys]|uniref:prothoracicotropic hormone n=1 Tax=Halyomorpha halys TaxID=286706 RepID=UPI0034D224F9